MDLSYLISISDGDKEFIMDFLSTFEQSTVPQINQLQVALEKHDLETVRKIAHQLKPTSELLKFTSHSMVLLLNKYPEQGKADEVYLIREEAMKTIAAIKDRFGID